jgi:ubiquinone/menaquinone biosynthesis C-methylase UbiE
VSQIPFPADTFDLVTAVETHFWLPDLCNDLREVLRVLKPRGVLAIIAEVYKGADTTTARLAEKYLPKTGMKLLSPDEHRDLLANTGGYTDVDVAVEPSKGWIFAGAKKASEAPL